MTNDPVSAGGRIAIRYAVSTGPALVAMPVALALPIGIWSGHMDGGGTVGFTGAVVVPLVAEYLRRGSLTLSNAATRRRCLAAMTALLKATPFLSVLALLLGLYGAVGCFGGDCARIDQPIAIVGLVLAVVAVLGSLALISLLRSDVWRQHRAASSAGTGPMF